jgi:hypothetical protein
MQGLRRIAVEACLSQLGRSAVRLGGIPARRRDQHADAADPCGAPLMLVVAGVVGFVGLCLLYKSDRERAWLVALVAIAVGLVLLTLPEPAEVALVIGGWLMAWAGDAARWLASYALVLGAWVLLWRLSRRWWRSYLDRSSAGRGGVLMLTVCLGLLVATLLRVAPFLPDEVRVAGEGARAGLESGVEKAMDEAGERLPSNGGGAPP